MAAPKKGADGWDACYHYTYNFNRRKEMTHNQQGFTLIELMIVVAIIGILAAIAIPSYQNYTKKAAYTEVVTAASPYKTGVEDCFQSGEVLADCDSGANGVPPAITAGTGLITSIAVVDGAITVTPAAAKGILATDTYILTPLSTANTGGSGNNLIWTTSGGGVTAGYAK